MKDVVSKIDFIMQEGTTYGKKKSKGWFKYRGLIAKAGNSKNKQMKVLQDIESSWREGEISRDEMDHLVSMIMSK